MLGNKESASVCFKCCSDMLLKEKNAILNYGLI